jgi:hypothetical protein
MAAKPDPASISGAGLGVAIAAEHAVTATTTAMNQVLIFIDELPKIYRLLKMYLVQPSQASALPALRGAATKETIVGLIFRSIETSRTQAT